nr:hypothetical protein CFP56_36381 [Quercus suber]
MDYARLFMPHPRLIQSAWFDPHDSPCLIRPGFFEPAAEAMLRAFRSPAFTGIPGGSWSRKPDHGLRLRLFHVLAHV